MSFSLLTTSASYDESNTINSLHSLMIEPTIGCTRGLYGLQYTRRHTFSHDGLCEELVDNSDDFSYYLEPLPLQLLN